MNIKDFGSLCSGIEAASFVLKSFNIKPLWLSEIADFQSRFLATRYPDIPNVGDMNDIPLKIEKKDIEAPDLICGGTPCQAFSLAGWRNGINDDRGQLTLKYIDVVNVNDRVRLSGKKNRTIFFWENVEGTLTDKTNAFGCFLAGLVGLNSPIISPLGKIKKRVDKKGNVSYIYPKWSNAGIIYGKERNIAWRVLDAKYFGLPQQRKRIYLLGGGKDFHPENILFERGKMLQDPYNISYFQNENIPFLFEDMQQRPIKFSLTKNVEGHRIEAFRSYADCLYAAYGTKWNGNAAAFNGSLFFSQNGRLRRLTPLECERLMGFPDNYTLIDKSRDTQRYQAIGNSWAVPVVDWIMNRLIDCAHNNVLCPKNPSLVIGDTKIYVFDDLTKMPEGYYINASKIPYDYKLANIIDLVDVECPDKFYISPIGCAGILRRKKKYNAGMNKRLEEVLMCCSN